MEPRKPWKGTMTQRDRFNAQMHYKSFDRSVNMEFGYWDENYHQWDIFVDNHITNEWEANQFFAFECPPCVGGNIWLSPCFEVKKLREEGDKEIWQNHEGVLLEMPKDGHSTIPRYIGSSIVTPDDWKREKELRFARFVGREPDYKYLDQVCREDRDYPVGIGCGSLIGNIRNMLTVEGLAYAVCDYPDMVEDMVETACVLAEDYLDKVLPKYHFDFATGWEDICCKNGPLVQMDFFKEVIYPRYKRIGDKLHAHGVDIWWTDCDGDVRPLIPYFLDAGVNCLFPYEVNSCAHPADLLSEYGGALRIMGGFDKIQMIKGKDAIKSYMQSIEPWVAKGGFIPFCDHRCPPDVTPENYLYYLDLKEQFFGWGAPAGNSTVAK